MKQFFLFFCTVISLFATAQTDTPFGDVNNDGVTNTADVVAIYNYIITGEKADIKAYINCPDDNHPHMIDLGLPSHTLWSCCNLGAAGPEDIGKYYAWGEITEYTEYSYQYYNYADFGSNIKGSIYDAAHVTLQGSWCMPSSVQCKELVNNTTSEWITKNGINGRTFTGFSGGSIFIPVTGHKWYEGLSGMGEGDYWSATSDYYVNNAYALSFYDTEIRNNYYIVRSIGLPIRPVASAQKDDTPFGDLNCDGAINTADIIAVYNYIITGEKTQPFLPKASDYITARRVSSVQSTTASGTYYGVKWIIANISSETIHIVSLGGNTNFACDITGGESKEVTLYDSTTDIYNSYQQFVFMADDTKFEIQI